MTIRKNHFFMKYSIGLLLASGVLTAQADVNQPNMAWTSPSSQATPKKPKTQAPKPIQLPQSVKPWFPPSQTTAHASPTTQNAAPHKQSHPPINKTPSMNQQLKAQEKQWF